MTSILGVKKIQYPNGTNAITVGADGVLTFDQKIVSTSTDSSTFAGPIIGNNGITAVGAGGTALATAPIRIFDENNNLASIGISNAGHLYFNNASNNSNFFFRTVVDNEVKFRIDYDGNVRVKGEGGSTGEKVNLRFGSIKSWASVQQTANPHVIEDSYNVSSVTDNGTGKSGNNFTNNMNNANYSVTLAQQDGGSYNDAGSVHTDNADAYSTSAIGYYAHFATAPNDANTAWCQVAGDLA